MKILFINACVRQASRTKRLAEHLLSRLEGDVTQLCLAEENMQPLTGESLAERERLISEKEYDAPMLKYARQFADADLIVIAAPYWEMSYPALLKIYFEAISVSGVTFRYIDGFPKGLCSAKKLIYVTTGGGPIATDFGYSYIETLAKSFYGIEETVCYKAENLDIVGMDVEALLREAEAKIDKDIVPNEI